MYTLEMATAFKSIVPPNKFGLTVLENPDFLTLVVDPKDLENLADGEIELIVKYINDVKKTLEDHGAIVFVVRDVLEK